MKFAGLLLTTLLTAVNAFAGEGDIAAQLGRLRDIFDSGIGIAKESKSAVPFGEGNWGRAPKIKTSGAKESWMTYNDAFQIESCQFVDAVFIKQPTLAEAQAALEGCMNSVSAKYKAKVTATLGEGELIIVVSGFIPSGSLVAADLRHALEIRKGELFGHSARVIRLAQSSEERRMSSLQFVVDRCPTIKMIRALRTTQDFIDIYGNCLREAKNLSIISVRNDPAEDLSILVYSNVAKHTIDEMNGVIRLVGDDGPVQIRVTAKKETIARSFLPAAVLPF